MFDTWAYTVGLFDHPVNEYKSIVATRVVHDYYDADPKRGFYGGGGIDSRFDLMPIGFALAGLPPDTPQWGRGYKKALGECFTHSSGLPAHCSCLPVYTNRVDLDPEVKDAWGLPAMRVTFDCHPDDVKTMEFMRDRMLEITAAAGARKKWALPIGEVLPSRHLMGTCRMGNDPRKSVVNVDNRSHDVANLFLVDGSSLVTSARQQPTATIQALAYRAAEKMTTLARSGGI